MKKLTQTDRSLLALKLIDGAILLSAEWSPEDRRDMAEEAAKTVDALSKDALTSYVRELVGSEGATRYRFPFFAYHAFSALTNIAGATEEFRTTPAADLKEAILPMLSEAQCMLDKLVVIVNGTRK